MASRLPTMMLVAATNASRRLPLRRRGGAPACEDADDHRRSAAALVPTDMNAVTGIGAPW